MKRLVIPLAAVALTLSLARCGGDDNKTADTGTTPAGKDAAHAGLDAGEEPGLDASTILPGPDATTVLPGPDASTTQPGPDASTTGPCDPFAQTGCTGQKCTIDQAGAILCGPAGSKADQETCTQDSECGAGLTCVGVTGETGMKCRAFCNTTKKCPTGQACVVAASASSGAILCMVVPACDPWTQTGCSTGQKCTLADPSPTFTCGPAGTKDNLATCANDTECKAGLVCLDFNDGPKCHFLCSATKACPTGEKCLGGSASSTDPFACVPTPSCDPLLQDCTGANQGCFPVSQTEWACATSMGKTAGQTCGYANDCVKGYMCANPGTGNICMQICNPTAGQPPTCTTGACQSQGTFGLCK